MITEDLTALFTDLAVQAVLHPATPGAVPIPASVFFDAAGVDIGDVITLEPTILAQSSAWPAAKVGDQIALQCARYRIRTIQPEGDGATVRFDLVRL